MQLTSFPFGSCGDLNEKCSPQVLARDTWCPAGCAVQEVTVNCPVLLVKGISLEKLWTNHKKIYLRGQLPYQTMQAQNNLQFTYSTKKVQNLQRILAKTKISSLKKNRKYTDNSQEYKSYSKSITGAVVQLSSTAFL